MAIYYQRKKTRKYINHDIEFVSDDTNEKQDSNEETYDEEDNTNK